MITLKGKLRKYFSGKLVLVQILGGAGAFAGRSAAAYLLAGHSVWAIVAACQAASFAGYIGVYSAGYWFAFRADYKARGRSMLLDIFRLQMVEQLPNLATVISAALAQAALMEGGGLSPALSANLASWFGPQKIANLAAMAAGNSLKKSWVDGTWRVQGRVHNFIRRVRYMGRSVPRVAEAEGTRESLEVDI